MDFYQALQEVDRDDGFWAHLVSKDGRAFRWKRYEEIPGGGWGPKVLDEGHNLFDHNDKEPPTLPWVVWLRRRGVPGEFAIGGPNGTDAQITLQEGRAFSWIFVKAAAGGLWTPAGAGGSSNAFEANGLTPPRLPFAIMIVPRSVPNEYMFYI